MKNLPYIKSQILVNSLYLLILSFAFMGCKKYFDPPDVFESQTIVKVKKRKVLLIGVDGISGADMKTIAAPNLTKMLANSKYSWDALGDFSVADGTAWKNIMAGVAIGKHKVADSTLDVPEGGIGNEHNAVTIWPSFIERLQGTGKVKRTLTITSWKTLNDKIFAYADFPIITQNDKQVRDSAVNRLGNTNTDLVVLNFDEVAKAGIINGFSADNAGYKNAVLKTDEYIGDVMTALKARKTYADEDWLVIVTSTHGGTGNGYGNPDNRSSERKIFTLYYNDNFKGLELLAPPSIDGIKFNNNAITARLAGADAAMYNFGSTGDFTIEFRLRINTFGTLNSTIFFKSASPANSSPGWWFIHNGSDGSWRFVVKRGPSGGSNKTLTSNSLGAAGPAKMVVDRWYRLTAKIYTENSKRYMIIYQDGEKAANPMEITGENIVNNEDLYAGFKSGYGNLTNQSIADIRIWNTALSDEKIAESACSTEVLTSDPNYGNLIGYWPGNDGLSFYKNQSPLAVGKDLQLSGSYAWEPLVKPTCGKDAPLLPNQVALTNSDIATQIFYWYDVPIDKKWSLDGKVFLTNYESEFYKK